MSEYIIIEGTTIAAHMCGPLPEADNVREVPDGWPGHIGVDIRSFDSDWRIRPLTKRIAEGLVQVSDREVVEGETVRAKNALECMRDGLDPAPKGQRLVEAKDGSLSLEEMTIQEQVDAGQMAKETAAVILAANERARRGSLLAECDWTQAPDSPLPSEKAAAWKIYRQALRDITLQGSWPWSIGWPSSPDGVRP